MSLVHDASSLFMVVLRTRRGWSLRFQADIPETFPTREARS